MVINRNNNLGKLISQISGNLPYSKILNMIYMVKYNLVLNIFNRAKSNHTILYEPSIESQFSTYLLHKDYWFA